MTFIEDLARNENLFLRVKKLEERQVSLIRNHGRMVLASLVFAVMGLLVITRKLDDKIIELVNRSVTAL